MSGLPYKGVTYGMVRSKGIEKPLEIVGKRAKEINGNSDENVKMGLQKQGQAAKGKVRTSYKGCGEAKKRWLQGHTPVQPS